MPSASCRVAARVGADLTSSARRTIAACALLLISAALALAAIVLPGHTGQQGQAADPLAPVSPFSQPSSGSLIRPLAHPSPPTGLIIPALGVRAPVVPLKPEGEVLTPPGNVSEVGWWSSGRRPGATTGNVLITGHTVHTGGGVFDNLGDLGVDDRVEVDTRNGPLVYRVDEVRYLSVPQLADEAPALFSYHGPPRLVLVTCAGWDGAQYAYHGNTVVIAEPVAPSHAHSHASSPTSSATSSPTVTPTPTPTPTSTPTPTPTTATAQTPSSVLTPPGLPYWYPQQPSATPAHRHKVTIGG